MGGKDLDLHVLYVEVTQRGGLQQVLHHRFLISVSISSCFMLATFFQMVVFHILHHCYELNLRTLI